MPKVLFINPAKNYGSTGKIVEEIGLLAQSKGWETCLIHAARYDRPSKLKCIKAGTKLTESWHAIIANLFDRQGLQSYFTTKLVLKNIKRFKPDIIHLHNIHGYFLNYPLLFKFLAEANIPIVWTMHDCWSFTGHCSYFDMVGCDKWKIKCHSCNNLANYPQSVWLDRSSKIYELKKELFTAVNNMVMVPVSKWLADITRQSFLGKYPITVIYNGIDLDVFRIKENTLRQKLNLEDKFVVLGVSSNGFTGRKGLNDFIELSKMLPEDYKIIMVGLKENELSQLPNNILGMRRTSNVEELVDLYNLADVFINPTYSDNFPTTNMESLACGTPVITYNTGGSPEAIDENTGVVIKQGDLYSLCKTIKQFRSTNFKSHTKFICRKRAEDEFNKEKCFERYINLYVELLK